MPKSAQTLETFARQTRSYAKSSCKHARMTRSTSFAFSTVGRKENLTSTVSFGHPSMTHELTGQAKTVLPFLMSTSKSQRSRNTSRTGRHSESPAGGCPGHRWLEGASTLLTITAKDDEFHRLFQAPHFTISA